MHQILELPAVVFGANGRGEGHCVRWDEVAPAQFVRRQAKVAGGCIDDAFHHICRFRPPGPAICVNGNRVGEDAPHMGIDGWCLVESAQHHISGQGEDEGRVAGKIGAIVRHSLHAQCQEPRLAVERQ